MELFCNETNLSLCPADNRYLILEILLAKKESMLLWFEWILEVYKSSLERSVHASNQSAPALSSFFVSTHLYSPQSFTCWLTAVENMAPDNRRLQTDVLKSPFDRPEHSWFSTHSVCLNAEAVSSLCLINCSFCSWLRYLHNAENFWDAVNPLLLSLITLDAPNALFSSPVGQHFVWCGCKVGLVHSFDAQYSGKHGKCEQTQACAQTVRHTDKCITWAVKKRQIRGSAFALTPCIHLLFLLLIHPTQYTYTQVLESSSHSQMHLTHFYSFVLLYGAWFYHFVMCLIWLSVFWLLCWWEIAVWTITTSKHYKYWREELNIFSVLVTLCF